MLKSLVRPGTAITQSTTHGPGCRPVGILGDSGSLEILEYLRENGETKQEVLRTTICRNHDVLSKRLVSLEGLGLIACDHRMCDESRHRANYWTLTEIGSAAAGMLEAVDLVILGRLDMESGAVREILMIVERTPPRREGPRRHPLL
ncbi:MAG: hypothetical protein Q4Q62_07480 [Thermoplasmata archaeon]|nr:hypothetical protein [Thermoplasmata archaeon]